MVIELLVISVIIGLIRGGNIGNLMNSAFNKVIMLILAIVVYVSFFHFTLRGYDVVLNHIGKLYIFIYALLIVGIIMNYNFRETWIIFIGALANLTTFLVNGYKMVFSVEGLNYVGLSEAAQGITTGTIEIFTPLTEMTKIGVLSRFIAVPRPYIYPQLFSIGDFLISLGVFLLIQNIMLDDNMGKNKMIKFSIK